MLLAAIPLFSFTAWAETYQWTQIKAHTGNIQTIAISPESPEILYIGTNDAGGFMSRDSGNSWPTADSFLTDQSIYTLVFSPDFGSTGIMYAGTMNEVYKTSNQGSTWEQKTTGSQNTSVPSVTASSFSPDTVYAGTGIDIWKSVNAGENWTSISNGITDNAANIRTIIVNSFSTDTIYAGALAGGVFRTTDGGALWESVNNGLANTGVWTLVPDPSSPGILYAGTNGGVFKTTDGGESWTSASTNIGSITVYALAVHPRNPAVIYAATKNGIFRTENGGVLWDKISSDTDFTIVRSLAIDGSAGTRIYAGTSTKGLFGCTVAVPGDINGDTVVGLDDAILGLKILAGINTDDVVVDMNADVNGDTRIGIEEVIFILKEVAASQII